jgi:hypothetical protein
MSRRREDPDPRVTDLSRYRKAREQQKRRAPPRQTESLLGGRPRAGLILVAVILALAALGLLQHLP